VPLDAATLQPAAQECRENSDQLREEFSKKKMAFTLDVRRRQVEDNRLRRINALHEQTAWDECEAFEGLKATMAGVAEAQKRIDEKTGTDRELGQQLRDKARREAMEKERDAAELEAVLAAQAAANGAAAAREAAIAAERRALSDAIRKYNLCATPLLLVLVFRSSEFSPQGLLEWRAWSS
jgi:hypothetical protein